MLAAYQRTGSGSGSCKEEHDRDNGNDVGARVRRVRSRFSIGLAGILVFRGLLVIRLGLSTARLVIRLRFPKLRPFNAVLRSVAALETRPFCSLLNVVLFHSERACSYASVRDATVSSVYLPNSASLACAAAIGASSALCRVRSDHHTWPDILGWSGLAS